ncbi:MAG: hypothetical protein ABSE73_07765 [Planctomycetota bacterium]
MSTTVSVHYSLLSNGVLPLWLCAVLGLAALAGAFFLLRAELARRRRVRPVWLYAVRAGILAALLFLLAQPVLFIRRETTRPAELVLVADRSRSMLRHDAYDETELLDLAAAAGTEGLESRERTPQILLRRLRREEEALRLWARQLEDISDQLAQGLPWGPGFSRQLGEQHKWLAQLLPALAGLGSELSRLERRIREGAEGPPPTPSREGRGKTKIPYTAAPFKAVAELLDRAEAFQRGLGAAEDKTLTAEQAAALLKAHEELAAAWSAAMPLLSALQERCDQALLKAQPEATRTLLKRLAELSRFEVAKRIVERLAGDPAFSSRHAVRLAGWEALNAQNAEPETDLFVPLEAVLARISRHVVAGLVLVTDGQQNLPERPALLRHIAGRGIPFVAAGAGRSGTLADVAILDYRIGRLQIAKRTATLAATLKTEVPAGTAIAVSLAAGGKTLANRTLAADGNPRAAVQLPFTVPEEAGGIWTLAARTAEPDAAPENDAVSFGVRVLQSPLRVLLVARAPRWDLVQLLRTLGTEPCRTDAVFWGAMAGNSGTDSQSRLKSGLVSVPEFRQCRRYQLVVLDDPPFPGMEEKDAALLRDYVLKDGGNLFVLAGEPGHSYLDALKFWDTIPISKQPGDSGGFRGHDPDFQTAGNRVMSPEIGSCPRISPAADSRLYEAVALAADGAASCGLWQALAPARLVRAVPAQDVVLLEANRTPCLTLGFRGRGKTYILGVGDLFRLREWGGAAQSRFLASLAEDALLPVFAGPQAKLAAYPTTPLAGAGLRVLLDSPGSPPGSAGQIKLPDGKEEVLSFSAPSAGGLCHAALALGGLPGRLRITGPQGEVFEPEAVAPIAAEQIQLDLDEGRLRHWARAAGGSYTALADLPEALAALEPRGEQEVHVRQILLWDLWGLLIAIALLLVADWTLRRRSGLVL